MAETPLSRATAAAGGIAAFCALVGIARRTYFNWKRSGVPLEELERVARLTGTTPAELRPDVARLFAVSGSEAA